MVTAAKKVACFWRGCDSCRRMDASTPPHNGAGSATVAPWRCEVGEHLPGKTIQHRSARVTEGAKTLRGQHFEEISCPTPRTQRVREELADRRRQPMHTRLALAQAKRPRRKAAGGGSYLRIQ